MWAMLRKALLGLGLGLVLVGCGSDQSDAVTGPEDEIVDVPSSRVKNQSIGNCWLYASMGWVESLHMRATGKELNLSETYLTYWDWYEKLVRATAAPDTIATGGFFTTATRLMNTYGLAEEGAFIPGEAEIDRSAVQSKAESYINTALKGTFKTDRSPKTLRAELDKAFGLTPEVIAHMHATFGDAAPRTLTTVSPGFKLFKSSELMVSQKRATSATATTVPLRDEISRWRENSAPSDRGQLRGYLRRIQKALHDAQPVLIVWNVDWESRNGSQGTFPKMQPNAKIDGVHMTVLEDYQAAYVPNLGTLPAGVNVSDKSVLDAALSSQVEIPFFRIKNSWGNTADPSGTGTFKGYVDLYDAYLFPTDATAPKGIVSFVLPSDYDTSTPAGIPADMCDKATSDGSFCASTLGASSTDKRLLTCDTGLTSAMKTCSTSCSAGACADPPPPNPCEKATAPGKYCGTTLGLAATDVNAAMLYSCQQDVDGKWISPGTKCEKGCTRVDGDSDRCN